MNIFRPLMIGLDRYLGALAVRLISCPIEQQQSSISRILFIRPGGIGDALLLLPTIAAISQRFTEATIEVLAERRNNEVFSWCPQVSRIWCYDHSPDLLCLCRGTYDVVIDSEQWYRLSAVVARLTRSTQIIGFAGNGREQMLTDPIAYDLASYEADSFRSLLAPLGVATEAAGQYLPVIPQSSITRAQELLHNAGLADKEYIVLFPGASVPEKIWPIERFIALADFARDLGYISVVVGGRGEVVTGEQITAGRSGINLAGKTTLSEAAAVVAQAAAFVSCDSGLLHIAAAFGVKTVALFGPSDWRKWGPRGEHVRIVATDCSCSPCSKFGTIPRCSTKYCMSLISIKQVTTAISDLTSCVKSSVSQY